MADEGTPGPELILADGAPSYKVGSRIKVELHNFTLEGDHGEVIEVPKLLMTPIGLETAHSETAEQPNWICYTLVPRKYGVFKVTVEGQEKCQLFVHVTPVGDLTLPSDRVSGDPPLQLPRDLLVTKDGGFIVADGIRRRVIGMDREGKEQVEFELPRDVEAEKFSPISLALKEDPGSEENNEVYVTDLNHACVRVYHGNKYLESFGSDHLKRPTGIALDDDGCVFVADHSQRKIFQFDPDYELVEDEASYELRGPQLMRIHKPTGSHNSEATLYVADRSDSRIAIFLLLRRASGDEDMEATNNRAKTLQWVGNIEITAVGLPPGPILPFCVVCDPDGHLFVSGQVKISDRESKGYIWFKDGNSSNFRGCEIPDWTFGDGLRNPGGMRIVDKPDGRRYLYVTDMRGKNANNCINRYSLTKKGPVVLPEM